MLHRRLRKRFGGLGLGGANTKLVRIYEVISSGIISLSDLNKVCESYNISLQKVHAEGSVRIEWLNQRAVQGLSV